MGLVSVSKVISLKKIAVGLFSMGAVSLILLSIPSKAAHAKPPLGRTWPSSRQISMDDADHLAYDTLLSKYVDRDGYMDYAAWKKSTADRQVLRGYLEHLSRDAQLKFWINAYNAVTLEGILQVYPTSSIRNHTAKLFGYNIWKELPLRVGHETYSLDQMEHEILRKMGGADSFCDRVCFGGVSAAAERSLYAGQSSAAIGQQCHRFLFPLPEFLS